MASRLCFKQFNTQYILFKEVELHQVLHDDQENEVLACLGAKIFLCFNHFQTK